MDIRVVAYKNIFSSAGVIKEFPVGTSIETVRKAFNLSQVARILCNDQPYTESTLQEGCEYSIYESVQGDAGEKIWDMGSSAVKTTKRLAEKAGLDLKNPLVQLFVVPGFYAAGIFDYMTGGMLSNILVPEADKSGSSGSKGAITSRPDIAGAKNQSLTGTSVPIILGTRRITPGVVGTYWTQPTITDAGEDIYLHGLLVAGYGPLMLRDFKLGDMPLGISTPRASVGNVVLTASEATSNFLAEGDEAIFHILQGEGTLDPRTYTKKVVEESVETEIIWPELNSVGTAITWAKYLESSPTRVTAMGVKSVSVMISANGFMHYKGNEEQVPDPITFTMYWRYPGEAEWRSFYGPTPAITINQAYKKEVRFNLTADWPHYTAGTNKAIEVTVVRSRTNRIDSKPDSDHSYLDSWRWDCIRTITNEEPLSAELCKKVCRIAFRIKATDRLAGTLDAINMVATSILPVVKTDNKWDLAPPSLPNYPSWEETENPADFFVAAFMDRWLLSEPYASGGAVHTGIAKLSLWQLNNIKIDWAALADFRRWCAEPRTVTLSDGTTYALDHQAEVNAYITGQKKLSDFLDSILTVARARFIYKDGKYSLIHDALYSGRGYADEALYNDKIHGKYVAAVLTPRIAKLTFSRKFADIYDEAVITFVTKAAKYYQQVSVTIRNPYIATADYNARKANGTLRVLKTSVDNITDVYQIKLWVTYMFAVSQHRQLTASAQIGHAQYAYPLGSRIAISHDAILKGYGSARIVRCEGTAPNIICTLDDEITAQSSNIYVTAQEEVDLTNTEPWYLTAEVPSANIIDPIALADGYITFRKFKLPVSLRRGPKEGDLCIFGQGTTIQEEFILVGKTVNEDHGATLSLVAAADEIHDIDSNTYTAYNYAVSPTWATVKSVAERSRPAAPNAQAQVGMIDSVLSEVHKIEFGDETVPPSDVPGITAIAYEDYISVEIDWNESGLNNTLSYFSVEVFNGSEWTEYIATSAFSRYTFDRTFDGYPEIEQTGAANALVNWRVRATAINIYGQESLGYGPSAAGVTLDVSNYKTWIPAVPVIKKWKAHETGIDYEFTIDQDSYYGLGKRFTLTVQGTPRIVDTRQTAGVFLFDRDVDGYPETIAERTAHNIVGGSALEQKTLTVRAITDYMQGTASAPVTPDVRAYLTWIPHVPTLRASASGRNVTLSMTPGNTTYGTPNYRLRVQRTGDAQMYALGDNALAYTIEEAYRGDPQPAYTETNLNSYTQVVPLIGQTMSLPEDTAYQYRVSIAIPVPTTAAPGAENSTLFEDSTLTAVLARGTNTIDIVSGAIRKDQLAESSVTNGKILDGAVTVSKLAIGDVTNLIRNSSGDLGTGETWHGGITAGSDATVGAYLIRPAGVRDMTTTYGIPVTAGEKFVCSMSAKAVGALGTVNKLNFMVREITAAGTIRDHAVVTAINIGSLTDWQDAIGVYTVPAGVTSIAVIVQVEGASGNTSEIGAWYVRNIVLRRQVGVTLIEDGAITTDKIQAGTITADNISVVARSKINSFVHAADGTTGWHFGAGCGIISVDSGNPRVLKLLAPNASFHTVDFDVQPNELLEFSFGIQCPNYTSQSGLYIGLKFGQLHQRFVWYTDTQRWEHPRVGTPYINTPTATTNEYFLFDFRSTSRLNVRTYILGYNVDIRDVPAPALSSPVEICCLRLPAGVTTTCLRSGNNDITSGTYWYIFQPQIYAVGSSKIVAQQIQVRDLSAISASLGQVLGDAGTENDYRLVLSSGYENTVGSRVGNYDYGKRGTLLLGAETDDSYFRRSYNYVTGKWEASLKVATFLVDSVSSTVLGTFRIKNSAQTATLLDANPDTGYIRVGYQTVSPNTAESARRIAIVPPGHTGGPYWISVADGPGTSELVFNYGTEPSSLRLTADGYAKVTKALTVSSDENYSVAIGLLANSWNNGSYPAIRNGKDANGWVMMRNLHIENTQPGYRGFSGTMRGATIRMEEVNADNQPTSHWDIGVGVGGSELSTFAIARDNAVTHKFYADGQAMLRPAYTQDIVRGRAGVQFAQAAGCPATGAADTLTHPNGDWYSDIILNHNNAGGYYQQISANFHSDSVYFKRVAAGTEYGFRRFLFDGDQNITASNFYGNTGNRMLWDSGSAWLYINPDNSYTEGIYCGTKKLRVDGEFQVGPDGTRFRVTTDGDFLAGPVAAPTFSYRAATGYINTKAIRMDDTSVSIGKSSGSSTGSVFLGFNAGPIATGSLNVCLGSNAGTHISSGGYNVCIGSSSGGAALTTMSQCVLIGTTTTVHASGGNYQISLGNRIRYFEFPTNTAYSTIYTVLSAYTNPTVGSNTACMMRWGTIEITRMIRVDASTIRLADNGNGGRVDLKPTLTTTLVTAKVQIVIIGYYA